MFKEYRLGKNYTKDSNRGLGGIIQRIERDFPGVKNSPELSLRFKLDLLYDLVESKHLWVMRYSPELIRWPNDPASSPGNKLGVYFPMEGEDLVEVGRVTIPRMAVGHVHDWPKDHEAIVGSGWKSKKHMVKGISDIYQPVYGNRLKPNDILVAYALKDFILHKEFANK